MSKPVTPRESLQRALLCHFCRLQLPSLALPAEKFDAHLERTYQLCARKADAELSWSRYLDNLYPLDWFVVCGCLEGDRLAWQYLFASRASRGDCLLVDALRSRAVRLFPRNPERQESAVAEFWGHLLVADTPGSLAVLARYDGQRPLVPWLIRVFQNWHLSQLRQRSVERPFPEDDVACPQPAEPDGAWHEAFRAAAREAVSALTDSELLILGLRLRYHMSQRDVAVILGLHEGTVSRQTAQLRERCLKAISSRLAGAGWTGDDLFELVRNEMGGLLLEEPRLAADRLAGVLAARGKLLPAEVRQAGGERSGEGGCGRGAKE